MRKEKAVIVGIHDRYDSKWEVDENMKDDFEEIKRSLIAVFI